LYSTVRQAQKQEQNQPAHRENQYGLGHLLAGVLHVHKKDEQTIDALQVAMTSATMVLKMPRSMVAIHARKVATIRIAQIIQ